MEREPAARRFRVKALIEDHQVDSAGVEFGGHVDWSSQRSARARRSSFVHLPGRVRGEVKQVGPAELRSAGPRARRPWFGRDL